MPSITFIRFIRTLKDKVRNAAAVEGSICEAYLVEETSTFASYYYPPDVPSRRTRVPRNDDGGEGCSIAPPFSIFNYPGRPSGKCTTCTLERREMEAAHLYVLLNCPEVEPYLNIYADMLRELGQSDTEIDKQISATFPTWFKEYVLNNNNVEDELLRNLAWGPVNKVNKWPVYSLNGYKFNTKDHGEGMRTTNYGVCVRGSGNGASGSDYYGVLTNIVEVRYPGWPIKKLVLFQCDWYDPTPNVGTRIDNYGIVEIRESRRYKKYDPFIFSQQAEQVYYTKYPEGHQGWLVVIKTKARNTIQSLETSSSSESDDDAPYQDDSIMEMPMTIADDNLEQSLVDEAGEMDELNGVDQLHLDIGEHDEFEEGIEYEDDPVEEADDMGELNGANQLDMELDEDAELEEVNEDEDIN